MTQDDRAMRVCIETSKTFIYMIWKFITHRMCNVWNAMQLMTHTFCSLTLEKCIFVFVWQITASDTVQCSFHMTNYEITEIKNNPQ